MSHAPTEWRPTHAIKPQLTPEAGAPEIEITAEMVQAGALALSSYDDTFETAEEAAVRIFRAMNSLAISALAEPEAEGYCDKYDTLRT
jgi:hypothetical protein